MSGHRAVCTMAALATVLTLGCSSGGMVRDPMRPGSGFGGPVRLTVQNNDFNDAVVYANWQGSVRHRVGLFTGKTEQTVTLEWRGDVVQFEVDFIAGSAFFIDPIDVQAGDHLDIVLMAESSKR